MLGLARRMAGGSASSACSLSLSSASSSTCYVTTKHERTVRHTLCVCNPVTHVSLQTMEGAARMLDPK